jgi:uncharacterized protein YfeS
MNIEDWSPITEIEFALVLGAQRRALDSAALELWIQHRVGSYTIRARRADHGVADFYVVAELGDRILLFEDNQNQFSIAPKPGEQTDDWVSCGDLRGGLYALAGLPEDAPSALSRPVERFASSMTRQHHPAGEFEEATRVELEKDEAHPRALELIPDDFFWDCTDELAPFGSDEGDQALHEFQSWRKENVDGPIELCLAWTIESVGEMDFSEYTDAIFDESTVRIQVEDPEFDDQQLIYATDVSVIATTFSQLVVEGKIDASAKPIARRAIKRQIVWAVSKPNWSQALQYIQNLRRLDVVLDQA